MPDAATGAPRAVRSPRLIAGLALALLAGAAFLLVPRAEQKPAGAREPGVAVSAATDATAGQPRVETADAPPVDAPAQEASQPASGSFAFPGEPAAAYAQQVYPACQAATRGFFPFFADSAQDAPPDQIRRLFGQAGMLPAFIETKLRPMIATDGPIWRWQPGPAAGAFDPATPDMLAKIPALTAVVDGGLEIGIDAVGFGGGVTRAELEWNGARLAFGRPGETRTMRWQLLPRAADASLALFRGDRQVWRYQQGGPWSLFRLIQQGRSEAGLDGGAATIFSDGTHSATLRLRVAGGGQPFGRGGIWAFRCPPAL